VRTLSPSLHLLGLDRARGYFPPLDWRLVRTLRPEVRFVENGPPEWHVRFVGQNALNQRLPVVHAAVHGVPWNRGRFRILLRVCGRRLRVFARRLRVEGRLRVRFVLREMDSPWDKKCSGHKLVGQADRECKGPVEKARR
jgi:hypothetical protein